jgi:thiosulfate/3-mercaptopyruvate sulfurtransferase
MKPMANSDSLINVAQLKELIGKDNVVVVDYSEKSGTVIPGAIWIDRTQLVRELDGDRMSIQTKEVHEKILGENGISNETTIITYDDSNNLYATRFLWQLRAYGHKNVKLLNGGTKAWIAAGGSTDNKPANPKPAVIYKAINNVGSIRADLADVLDATHNSNWSLIDIRTQQEWDGGRVPGAIQFTYPTDIVNSDGTFKTVEEYEMLLRNIPKNTKIITYCMGGIRAASMLYVFTDFLGWPERVLNYDGSWWNYDWSKSTVEK